MTIIPYRKRSATTTPTMTTGFDEIDRLFNNMFSNALTNLSTGAPSVTDWNLRLDVSETDKAYVVTAELPGLSEDDVEITIDEDVLTISGEKAQEEEDEGKTFHRVERSYGTFTRRLSLPADVNDNDIEAHMKNGILEITIGKAEEVQKKAKKITVQSK